MFKLIGLLFISCILNVNANTGEEFISLMKRYTNSAVSGKYQQIKSLKAMDLELKSSGEFNYSKKRMVWKQVSPVENVIVFNHDSNKDIPDFIYSFLSPFFSGSLNESYLDTVVISQERPIAQDKPRFFKIIPKDEQLKKIISYISIGIGNQYIDKFVVYQANGDTLKIRFLDVTKK